LRNAVGRPGSAIFSAGAFSGRERVLGGGQRAESRRVEAGMSQAQLVRAWISEAAGLAAARGSRRGRWGRVAGRVLALLVLAVCAAAVLRLTLTPSKASAGIAHTNLKPGATIRLYLRQPSIRETLVEVGGNVLIGVPFGLLLPSISPRLRGLLRVLLVTGFFTTLIELAQHFFVRGRSFDIDDIILAGVGAAVGYLPFGRYFSLRLHPGHRHWWQRGWDRIARRG
jgi:glycopeptide antibiotics resistance protein